MRLDCPEVAPALAGARASLVAADRGLRKFAPGDARGAVLPAMLLYALPVKPEHVLGRGAWVGVRRRQRGAAASSYHAIFLEVAPSMLCLPDPAQTRYELCS